MAVDTLIGDSFGAEFPREILRNLGIGYRIADKSTSACFSELGPLLNSREILLPQHQIALDQLGALERKPSSRGKEFIGHPNGGHDDVAAAIAVAAAHCDFWKGDKVYWSMIDPGGRLISNEGGIMTVVQLDDAGEPIGPIKTISQEDISMSPLDRSRRAALGPNWRSLIAPSDPSYRAPKNDQ